MTASMYDCWLGYPPLGADALTVDERDLLSRFAAAGACAKREAFAREAIRT